jgi:hypothetical protein
MDERLCDMKKNMAFLLTLIALLSSTLACGQTTESTPETTPTIGPTPTALPLQASGLESITVRTLCLEVDQSFPEITDPELVEIAPKISETTQRVLAGLGMEVVEDNCDATLAITMTGEAIGASYQNIGFCYEGADVQGEIRLSIINHAPLSMPISGSFEPRSIIREDFCAKEPFLAPFSLVWPAALLEGLAQFWGLDVLASAMWDEEWDVGQAAIQLMGKFGSAEETAFALIQILESDKSSFVRSDAARALGQIGREVEEVIPALLRALEDEEEFVREAAARALGDIGPTAIDAVPALIQTMRKPDYFVRKNCAEALKAITGQDFGEDTKAWERWWEEQQ